MSALRGIPEHDRPGRFRYRAAGPDGRIKRGSAVAGSEASLVRELRRQDLVVLDIKRRSGLLPERPVRTRDLSVAFRNMATLIDAGVPAERAIKASESLVPPRLGGALSEARKLIRRGESVARALSRAPSVFPRSAVGMIHAGEVGSSLAEACSAVAGQLEESANMRSRVKAALAYPALICLVGLSTIVVMVTVVIPRFASILSDLGTELPPATRALLSASVLVDRFGLHMALVLLSVSAVGFRALQKSGPRARVHRVILRLPLIGRVRMGFATSRICRALGGMLQQGMPLLAAMDTAREAAGDLEMARRLAIARGRVAEGRSLSDALASEGVLTQEALQLVGIGEASAQLGPMMVRAADVASDRAERLLRTVVSLLEPLLVVVIGLAVAAISAALLQAVYSIRPV